MDANVAPRLMTPTPRILSGQNPFQVPTEYDGLLPVPSSVPHYSETMYFAVCDRHEPGLGVFMHTGRMAGDLDLWWARTVVYLPGGEVVVDRSFGRAPDNCGPATGNMSIRCEEPHRRWALHYDGAGELTTRDATALGLAGAGPPTPMRFDIQADAVSPIWDMPASVGLTQMEHTDAVYAQGHHQQAFTAHGELTVGGRRWTIDGVAYRDHSWGPRELSELGGDAFVSLVFPDSGRVVSGWELWNVAGEVNFRGFYIWENGEMELISEGSVERAVDCSSNPRTGLEVTMRRASGELLTLPGEVLNGVTISVITPNENVNGAALGDDAFLANEDIVRFVWPDGEVGFGHLERSLRPADLQR